jgi:hypothetical protein
VVPYPGSLGSDEDLKAWVTAEKMPLTIEFSQETSEKIFNSGISKQVGGCGGGEGVQVPLAVQVA